MPVNRKAWDHHCPWCGVGEENTRTTRSDGLYYFSQCKKCFEAFEVNLKEGMVIWETQNEHTSSSSSTKEVKTKSKNLITLIVVAAIAIGGISKFVYHAVMQSDAESVYKVCMMNVLSEGKESVLEKISRFHKGEIASKNINKEWMVDFEEITRSTNSAAGMDLVMNMQILLEHLKDHPLSKYFHNETRDRRQNLVDLRDNIRGPIKECNKQKKRWTQYRKTLVGFTLTKCGFEDPLKLKGNGKTKD